jgi:hypothetical protein
MTELQRTGFFREMPHGEATDPSLADARNAAPTPHEDRVAAYLDAGHVYIATPGFARDVFDPGKRIGPPHYLTDGRFVWPGDLSHYVRTYHVRLAGQFVEHMLGNGWGVPPDVDVAKLAGPGRSAKAPSGEATPIDGPRVVEAPPGAGEAAQPTDLPDLGALFSDFIGAARDALSGANGEALRSQLGAIGSAASKLVDSIAPVDSERRERIAAETEAFKKTIEDAGSEAARAAEAFGDDLRKALEDAGSKARTRLSSSLRSLSDWLEKPDEERTAQVQSLVTSFQTKLDESLAPQRLAEESERAKRLATEIRSSIADRLREKGLEPGSGSADEPKKPDES